MENELTDYEQKVIASFDKLLHDTKLHYLVKFKPSGEGVICISKENGIWATYVAKRKKKEYQREFDDIYDAIIDLLDFYTLGVEEKKYILDKLPSKESFKDPTR